MMTEDDPGETVILPGGSLALPMAALMRLTGLSREEVLQALDTIKSLNLGD